MTCILKHKTLLVWKRFHVFIVIMFVLCLVPQARADDAVAVYISRGEFSDLFASDNAYLSVLFDSVARGVRDLSPKVYCVENEDEADILIGVSVFTQKGGEAPFLGGRQAGIGVSVSAVCSPVFNLIVGPTIEPESDWHAFFQRDEVDEMARFGRIAGQNVIRCRLDYVLEAKRDLAPYIASVKKLQKEILESISKKRDDKLSSYIRHRHWAILEGKEKTKSN